MSFEPNALCFGDNFPASGAPCLVRIDSLGITATFLSDAAEGPSESVSFSDLTVAVGGLDHDQLVVKWAGPKGERTLYLKNVDVIRAFRQAAPGQLRTPLERAAARVRQVRHRHRLAWSIAGGIVLAVALGFWFGSDLLVGLAVDRIPVEWEQKLGESASGDFLAHQEIVKEGIAVSAVEEITQRLVEQIVGGLEPEPA